MDSAFDDDYAAWADQYEQESRRYREENEKTTEEYTMSFKMKAGGNGDFERPTPGTKMGLCYGLVDIGVQPTNFGQKQQVIILWELPDELMQDGRPFGVSKTYTASMNEKAQLRKDIESWRGRKFASDEEAEAYEVPKILGQACLITLSETTKGDKTYTNVGAIAPLMKGMTAPKAHNELVIFDMDSPDGMIYERLPKWIKQKIDSAEKSGGPHYEPAHEPAFDDDIPF